MPLDVARRGTLDVRDPPLKAIVAANDDYEAGYHKGNAGGLDAIDTDLATANIKFGITMFGFAGHADVRDISDATAIAAEVIDGETFYAVSGGIRTGTMPIVALNPAENLYPAGYHAGDVSLTAVDAQLVTGNIRSGITIFGVAGHINVRDVSDANALVAEVKTGRTFYAVGGARKTGTMPTVALNAGANAYPAGYHVGAANLTAVDGDLVAANIKDGITIFGVLGTLVGGTKEFFAPATGGVLSSQLGYHTGYTIVTTTNIRAFTEFQVPPDFTSITEAVVVFIANATATHRVNLWSDYAASGQAYNTHSESANDIDTAMTATLIYELDISGILSALAADDYVGIQVLRDTTNPPDLLFLGVRFKYS